MSLNGENGMNPVDCIITAAGLSSRMGQWKMMLPWHNGTILDASIRNAQRFCTRIILVTGYRAPEIEARYHNAPGIELIHNPEFEQGLLSSIRTASRAINSEYCFISHGDLPCLPRAVFSALWSLRGAEAILPHYQGTPGHPILIPRRLLQQALETGTGNSVRKILLAGKHRQVALNNPEIIFDIDTPDDFRRLQTIHAN